MRVKHILAAAVLGLGLAGCEQGSAEVPGATVTLPETNSVQQPAPSKDEDVIKPSGASATFEMQISGMMCEGCQKTVTNLILGVEGVESAEVDLKSGRALVKGKPGAKVTTEKLSEAVAQDYEVTSCIRLTN